MFHIRALKEYLHRCSEATKNDGKIFFNKYHYHLHVSVINKYNTGQQNLTFSCPTNFNIWN